MLCLGIGDKARAAGVACGGRAVGRVRVPVLRQAGRGQDVQDGAGEALANQYKRSVKHKGSGNPDPCFELNTCNGLFVVKESLGSDIDDLEAMRREIRTETADKDSKMLLQPLTYAYMVMMHPFGEVDPRWSLYFILTPKPCGTLLDVFNWL